MAPHFVAAHSTADLAVHHRQEMQAMLFHLPPGLGAVLVFRDTMISLEGLTLSKRKKTQ